ncbi:MAG: STAS domain-containing protein [Verrucomicrobiota bacterium]
MISIHDTKFDASSVEDFRSRLGDHWDDRVNDVSIDFQGVDFIDSSGIGALLSVQKRLRQDSQPIAILNARDNVRAIIELLRLQRVFNVKSETADA